MFPKLKVEKSIINEKYSYLTIKKGVTPNVKYETEEDTTIPHEKSFFWSRVLRYYFFITKTTNKKATACNFGSLHE